MTDKPFDGKHLSDAGCFLLITSQVSPSLLVKMRRHLTKCPKCRGLVAQHVVLKTTQMLAAEASMGSSVDGSMAESVLEAMKIQPGKEMTSIQSIAQSLKENMAPALEPLAGTFPIEPHSFFEALKQTFSHPQALATTTANGELVMEFDPVHLVVCRSCSAAAERRWYALKQWIAASSNSQHPYLEQLRKYFTTLTEVLQMAGFLPSDKPDGPTLTGDESISMDM